MKSAFPRLIVIMLHLSFTLEAQAPLPLAGFLRQAVGVSASDLIALDKGQILVRLPRTPETREVAAFAVMRVDVSTDFFVDRVRDIASFKKNDNVLQIGKFSNPPRIEDLAGLTLDASDIEGIRRCRLGACDVKLSARQIERFRREVTWSTPGYRERATALMRVMLLEYVKAYLSEGNAGLLEYRDKPYALSLADEFRTLLEPAPYMYGYDSGFQKYIREFPKTRDANAEDFVYWSKDKFGVKQVISLTHVTIYKRQGADGTDALIASKGIYATHYFEASVGLTSFVHTRADGTPRTYLVYVNRSRVDVLRGFFAGLKRSLISSSLRDGARNSMEAIKKKLEGEYVK